jgi:hypothetical protein
MVNATEIKRNFDQLGDLSRQRSTIPTASALNSTFREGLKKYALFMGHNFQVSLIVDSKLISNDICSKIISETFISLDVVVI